MTVDAGVDEGFVVSNTASATGTGASAGRTVSAVSPTVTSVVHVPPVLPTIEVTPETPTAGEVAIAEITFENTTDEPIEDVVITIDVPGADVLSATVEGGGKCTLRDDVARCPLGTLDPGERATVRVRFRPADDGELAPVVTIRGDGIPKLTRTLGPIRVKPGKARLVIRKRAGALGRPAGGHRLLPDRRPGAQARRDRPRPARVRRRGAGHPAAVGLARARAGRARLLEDRQARARPEPHAEGAGTRHGGERRRPQRRHRPRGEPAPPADTRERRARAGGAGVPAGVRERGTPGASRLLSGPQRVVDFRGVALKGALNRGLTRATGYELRRARPSPSAASARPARRATAC